MVAEPDVTGRVNALAKDACHRFSKRPSPRIELIEGIGVAGDAHAGVTVQHRSRVAADPTQPNLRQVHLIQAELLDELRDQGFDISPADLGENILTQGIDLLALPQGARLRIGETAVVEIKGLRNPCAQIETFRKGLLAAVLTRGPDGGLVRKAGVMGIVLAGGPVGVGDEIAVDLPPPPHRALERV